MLNVLVVVARLRRPRLVLVFFVLHSSIHPFLLFPSAFTFACPSPASPFTLSHQFARNSFLSAACLDRNACPCPCFLVAMVSRPTHPPCITTLVIHNGIILYPATLSTKAAARATRAVDDLICLAFRACLPHLARASLTALDFFDTCFFFLQGQPFCKTLYTRLGEMQSCQNDVIWVFLRRRCRLLAVATE
jgi:hypothetical protein